MRRFADKYIDDQEITEDDLHSIVLYDTHNALLTLQRLLKVIQCTSPDLDELLDDMANIADLDIDVDRMTRIARISKMLHERFLEATASTHKLSRSHYNRSI